jgi:putative tricarboxylic transport membrane protein
MVLGEIMEGKLRTSMMSVKTPVDFINRPIAFILFAIIILIILLQIRTLWKNFKTK